MAHAFASQDSQAFIAHSLHAPHPALAMVNASLWEHKWHVCAILVSKVMIVLRNLAPMTAPNTENASTAFARVTMVGVVQIARLDALELASAAVEMESVLRVSATATLGGLATLATFAHACMIVLNTAIATTALVFAKRDTVVVTARSHPSLNHASVRFTVCVDVSSNVLRCMRHKEQVHPTSATHPAPKSVFLNALRVKCPSVSLAPPVFPLMTHLHLPIWHTLASFKIN